MTRLVVTRRTILGAAAATAAGGLLGRAGAEEPVKGGWVYVGPVGDFGYSYQHDQGRKAVDVSGLYDASSYRAKLMRVEGMPMFLY